MTAKEILDKLKEITNGDPSNIGYRDFDDSPFGNVVYNVYKTGGEDEGSNWCRVHHFVDHDVYIGVYGYYTSHYGVDFDDWDDCVKAVRPVEKTITVFA